MRSFKFHKFSEELFRRTSATIEDKICHVKYGFKVNESWYEQRHLAGNYFCKNSSIVDVRLGSTYAYNEGAE